MVGRYDELEPWYEHLYAVLHPILFTALGAAGPAERGPGPAGRALDAGCGTGYQASQLAALGYEVHGVDISATSLAVARRRGARPVLATIEALPYPDGAFDAVVCCGSTLSFVDRPAGALDELGRVLRPGGRLLLECEHRWNLDLVWALVSGLAGGALGYRVTVSDALRHLLTAPRQGIAVDYPGYGTLHLFTMSELRAMLGRAGLRVERAWGIHAATNLIPSTVLHREHLSRPLAALYRGLCAVDDVLRSLGVAHVAASSAVVLARKDATGPAGGDALALRTALHAVAAGR
jgi:SAM-dependent methyltransferase